MLRQLFAVCLVVLVLVPLCLLLTLYFSPHKRSILIDAQTRSVSVELSGLKNQWQLAGEVILCERLEGSPRDLRLLAQAAAKSGTTVQGQCGDGAFKPITLQSPVLDWPNGAFIRINSGPAHSPFRIIYEGGILQSNQVAFDSVPPEGSYYLLSAEAVRNSGIARFKGNIQLGEVPTSGANHYLLSGRYELWDIPRWDRSPMKTLQGPLLRGDLVSVVRNAACRDDCDVLGEVIIEFDETSSVLSTVMYAGEKDDRLKINRFGASDSFIESNWFDRAKNDGFLIALSSSLAALVALSGLMSGLFRLCCFCSQTLQMERNIIAVSVVSLTVITGLFLYAWL